MPSAATLTSIGVGICVGHSPPIAMTGAISTGSSDVTCGESGVARTGDIVLGYCGHTGVIAESSGTVTANGRGKARIGDAFTGTFSGILTSGGIDSVQIGN